MGRDLTGPDFLEARVTAYLEDFFRGSRRPLGTSAGRPAARQHSRLVRAARRRAHPRLRSASGHGADRRHDHRPVGARIEDGRLYGRGACDVKGGMAAMLTAFARVVREKPAVAARVVMACTVDEEFTFLGVQRWRRPICAADAPAARSSCGRADRPGRGPRPQGAVRWDLLTAGRSCHSSRPEIGVNAIYHMADSLTARRALRRGVAGRRVDPLLGPATLSVGRIEGGVSVNTCPTAAASRSTAACCPAKTATPRPATCSPISVSASATTSPSPSAIPGQRPALDPTGSEELVARLLAPPNLSPESAASWPFPTAPTPGRFRRAGVPCVVFGPGDIARADTCDEWVPLDESRRRPRFCTGWRA